VKRILLYAGLILLLIVAVVVGVGYSLPVAHEAWQSSSSRRPTAEVFAVITDYARYPEWRTGVARVEVEGPSGVGQLIREHMDGDVIPFRIETFEPPSRIVARIADPDLPFGGTWTFEITPSDAGSDIVLTEHGEIYNPVFRFMARFVFGYESTIEQYLADLRKKLGDPEVRLPPR
jgi:hypothetical protein